MLDRMLRRRPPRRWEHPPRPLLLRDHDILNYLRWAEHAMELCDVYNPAQVCIAVRGLGHDIPKPIVSREDQYIFDDLMALANLARGIDTPSWTRFVLEVTDRACGRHVTCMVPASASVGQDAETGSGSIGDASPTELHIDEANLRPDGRRHTKTGVDSSRARRPKRRLKSHKSCWCGSSVNYEKCHREDDEPHYAPNGRLIPDSATDSCWCGSRLRYGSCHQGSM